MNYEALGYTFFLSEDAKITSGGTNNTQTESESQTPTSTSTGTPSNTNADIPLEGGVFGNQWVTLILYVAFIGGVFYFLMIRPQRKRDKKMKELQESLSVGDPVLLSSGMYGKIVDVGEEVYVIELGNNRGVRVPVNKSDVLARKEPRMTAPRMEEIPEK